MSCSNKIACHQQGRDVLHDAYLMRFATVPWSQRDTEVLHSSFGCEMELTQIDPIKREPVATQVARRLVEYLLSGAVEPGTRMPSERQLAEAFGVGRSAMREACATHPATSQWSESTTATTPGSSTAPPAAIRSCRSKS